MTSDIRYLDILPLRFDKVNTPGIVVPMTLGELISTRREELGMTQEDVEDASGVRQNTLSRIESGDTPTPRHITLTALSKVLGLDIGKMYVEMGAASTVEQGRRIAAVRNAAVHDDASFTQDALLAELTNRTLNKAQVTALRAVLMSWKR